VVEILDVLSRLYRYQQGLSIRLKPWFLFNEIKSKLTKDRSAYRMSVPCVRYPMLLRPCTSDIAVFKGVFMQHEYSCIDDLENVQFIVDCGGNAGYSSAYLLSRFEQAECIAVEPDRSNYELMVENLKPFGNRVRTIHGGIWSHVTYLKTVDNKYRGGHKYAVQVQECQKEDFGAIPAIDMLTILNQSVHRRVSILKVDIEGAEAVMFSAGCEKWLPYIDNMVIELHDDTFFGPATELVMKKLMEQSRFDISEFGELTVFRSRVDSELN